MAVDKLVDSAQLDTDLTAVANAIRTKGGTSASLTFPNGFVDAIDDIETGGGTDYLAQATNNTLTSYSSDAVTAVRASAFSGVTALQRISLPNATMINASAFANCTNLSSVEIPSVTNILPNAFNNCSALTSIDLKSVTLIGSSGFAFSALTVLCAPNAKVRTQVSRNNIHLTTVDILAGAANDAGTTMGISAYTFQSNTALTTLILRSTDFCKLDNISAFTDTPFASGGSGGTLYVSSALVSQYTQATNWSTILGYTNNQILPIEGSIYETQYADGTPIT